MGNPDHLAWLKEGVNAWNAYTTLEGLTQGEQTFQERTLIPS